ncbi:MAG: fimbrial protein [Plesiomonas sp.]
MKITVLSSLMKCYVFFAILHSVTVSSNGFGKVNMQGEIISTACSISVESVDQTINMGVTSISDIVRNGQSSRQPFSIRLVNCVLEKPNGDDWKSFQITFDGNVENKSFGVYGSTSGVALKITDYIGNVATPGIPMPLTELLHESNTLDYSMILVSDGHRLAPGSYSSSIRFKIDYF